MKVITDSKPLTAALRTAKPAIATRSALAVLRGVRLDAADGQVTVTATDLDLTVTVTVPCNVETAGTSIVSLTELTAAAKRKGSIELTVHEGMLSAHNGATSRLPQLSVDDWPRFVEEWEPAVPLNMAAVRSVLAAASGNGARPILTGVQFNAASDKQRTFAGPHLVATDSYRLHICEDDAGAWTTDMLVPARVLDQVAKVKTPVTMARSADGRSVRFASAGTTWTSRLIDGEFPNYRQLVPASLPFQLVASRPAFDEAIAFVGKSAGRGNAMRVAEASPTTIELYVVEDGNKVASEIVSGTTPVAFGVNPGYFGDLFDGLDACTLDMIDALKPVVLRDTDGAGLRHTRLLMPVRVS